MILKSPCFVNFKYPEFNVSLSDSITKLWYSSMFTDQREKPNDVFKQGLVYVANEKDSEPLIMVNESQPFKFSSVTNCAENWTFDLSNSDFLNSDFWQETKSNNGINNFFI